MSGDMNLRPLYLLPFLAVACSDGDEPPDHVFAQTTRLVQYETCGALETDLKDMLIREAWANIDRADYRYGAGAPEDASGDSGGGDRQEGVDYSGTNNQETGVDEADLVKTDGFHIYTLNGNRLHIFGVPQFGTLVPESETKLEGHPRQMLLHKDANRAVVFSYINVSALPLEHPLRAALGVRDTQDRWRVPMVSKITVLDITDRTAPRLVREVYYEGYYQTARRIDTSIRVAAYGVIDRQEVWDWYDVYNETNSKSLTKGIVRDRINALALADLIPQIYVRTPDGRLTSDSLTTSSCQSFFRPTDSHARGIASLISFDLLGESLRWDADHVVASPPTFYASTDTIVLAENAHDWWWYWWYRDDPDQLNVHTFDISTPGKSTYVGSGRVTGRLIDQFAIDEHEGAVRLATTTDLAWRWWAGEERPEPENHVWVLERRGSELEPVGHLGGIAKGERIMSARFLDDKAFLVTFRMIDPLFTIDLSKRDQPRVVGELKVPGFSTYLHPLADGSLLSIGVGGDETGANWRTTISLFDVSNLANPVQTAALPIEADQGWGWSEALWEHKAFQYWAPKKLLAIPQATWARTATGDYRYLSRLEMVEVDPGVGLRRYGAIDHTPYYEADNDRYWYFTDIRRSIFMGDYVYAISDKAITAHRTSDLGRVAEQLLPGFTLNDWYWWW